MLDRPIVERIKPMKMIVPNRIMSLEIEKFFPNIKQVILHMNAPKNNKIGPNAKDAGISWAILKVKRTVRNENTSVKSATKATI